MSKIIVRDVTGEHSYSIQDSVTVGRHPNSVICLHDPMVSKHHARIQHIGEHFIVTRPGWVKTLAFRRRLQHEMLELWRRATEKRARLFSRRKSIRLGFENSKWQYFNFDTGCYEQRH